jgi:hypothetical protein
MLDINPKPFKQKKFVVPPRPDHEMCSPQNQEVNSG